MGIFSHPRGHRADYPSFAPWRDRADEQATDEAQAGIANPAATRADLLGFIVALGWEGPLIAGLGIVHGVLFETLGGVVITILLWVYIGLPLWSAQRGKPSKRSRR